MILQQNPYITADIHTLVTELTVLACLC